MSALFAFPIRIGFKGIADCAIALIEARMAPSDDRAAIDARTTAKLSFPWF
ncbi:hypothetical protein [Yoonia vestfoldensis]|uniref:hypothetical protein n=1 Tax=Yoonia vestfoldensis TaxID=245188 RepID=UPI00035C91D1|nr:hypothetical protein [Yoonia vestfoldensis]